MSLSLKDEESTYREPDIKLARKGSKEAFSRLIKDNETSMYRTAKAILKNDEDCADAIQEAIIKAYKGILKLKKEEFFKTWLIKIVINESSRILKCKNRLIPVNEIRGDNGDNENEQNGIDVRNAVDTLESDLKLVTVLHYFEDLSVKKISDILKIPEGTVKSRLSRARQALCQALELKEGI